MNTIATPGTPAASKIYLFPRLNGASKVEYCIKFPNGTVTVLATEP